MAIVSDNLSLLWDGEYREEHVKAKTLKYDAFCRLCDFHVFNDVVTHESLILCLDDIQILLLIISILKPTNAAFTNLALLIK